MKKKFLFLNLALISSILLISCVPARKYDELKAKNYACEIEKQTLKQKVEDCQNDALNKEKDNQDLSKTVKRIKEDSIRKAQQMQELVNNFDKINKINSELQDKQKSIISGGELEVKRLATRVEENERRLKQKENELNNKQITLEELEKELEERNSKMNELQKSLNEKDAAVKDIKQKVSRALVGFENNGLTINTKNGKVYVSMEDKLLFKSASYELDSKGENALKELAKVLQENADINILIEGHTDDVPLKGRNEIQDNWDLSVKRATSVARILLKYSSINAKRITASGRSEYSPIEIGKTPEARQKNRRTEIILTPKLDELFKILDSN